MDVTNDRNFVILHARSKAAYDDPVTQAKWKTIKAKSLVLRITAFTNA